MKSLKRKENRTTYKREYKNKKKTIKLKRRKNNDYKKNNNNIYTRKRKNSKKTKIQRGGDMPMSKIVKDINFFTDKDRETYRDIEEYLNPVYGVIMCESGYIENNYYIAEQINPRDPLVEVIAPEGLTVPGAASVAVEGLAQEAASPEKKEEIDIDLTAELSDEMKFIQKISISVPPYIKPTKDIIGAIDPYTIGRYIAILYFYLKTRNRKMYDLLITSLIEEKETLIEVEEEKEKESKTKAFTNAFDLLKSHLNDRKETSKEIFHILLYCLWWTAGNLDGIKNYYKGVNESFTQINKTEMPEIPQSDIREAIIKVNKEYFDTKYPIRYAKDQSSRKKMLDEMNAEKRKDPLDNQVKEISDFIKKINTKQLELSDIEIEKKEKIDKVYKVLQETKLKDVKDFNVFPIIGVKDKFSDEKMEESDEPSFESTVGDVIYNPIKILTYVHFTDSFKSTKYPDCVETAAKNFINLLLYDYETMTFKLTDKFKGMNANTADYYKVFSSFDSQLSTAKKSIYGLNLNAIDAWSYLIIYFANTNISFDNKFEGKGESTYEVDSGVMSVDKTKTNFIQLLQNLLSPDIIKPDTLKEDLLELNVKIKSVKDDDDAFKKGVGTVLIEYEPSYTVTVRLKIGHSYVSIEDETRDQKVGKKFEDNKYIRYLIGDYGVVKKDEDGVIQKDIDGDVIITYEKVTDKNYLWFKYTVDNLDGVYNYIKNHDKDNKPLTTNFLRLLSSDLADEGTRIDVIINTDELDDILLKVKRFKKVKKVGNDVKYSVADEFAYKSNDFKFIDKLPYLTELNHSFLDKKSIKTIDLTPLKKLKLKIIGDFFANGCGSLKTIELIDLPELTTFGEEFANGCYSLKTIKISNLPNLKTIGDMFAFGCSELTSIIISNLPNLKTIGDMFASRCISLTKINITLPNLETIGENFMKACDLKTIKLTLPALKTIGNRFVIMCDELKTIDLTLPKLETIGLFFAGDCSQLIEIKLNGLSSLKTIGKGFAAGCPNLQTIILQDIPPSLDISSITSMYPGKVKVVESHTTSMHPENVEVVENQTRKRKLTDSPSSAEPPPNKKNFNQPNATEVTMHEVKSQE